jgi:cytochrome c biogenesis protein CcmG/thiol:disulfide interchange protein DsbE
LAGADTTETTDAAADAGPPPPDPGPPGAGGPPPRRPRKIFLLLGGALAAALAVGLFTTTGTSPHSGPPGTGDPAPHWSLPRLGGGGRVSVPADGGGSGRPAVLLFFASWCTSCGPEMPKLAAAVRAEQAAHAPTARIAVVGVDELDPTASAEKFVAHAGVTFPVAVDADGTVASARYEFTGIPEAVFIDGDGRIAGIAHGPISAAQLERWQRRLLSTGAASPA